MIKELDTVVLTHDIEDYELKQGDLGTVVHIYKDGLQFEVEFVTAEGKTIAVLTFGKNEIRSLKDKEILHARELTQVFR